MAAAVNLQAGLSWVTSTFFEELSSTLETLVVHGCPVVGGGDPKVHVEDPSDASAVRLSDLFQSMNMKQHVCPHTRPVALSTSSLCFLISTWKTSTWIRRRE